MAQAFNLTAQLNLRGPANVAAVVSQIRRQLQGISANINVAISPVASRNVAQLTTSLNALNTTLSAVQTNATTTAASITTLTTALGSMGGANMGQQLNATATAVQQLGTNAGVAAGGAGGAGVRALTSEMQEFGRQSALAVRRFAAMSIVTTTVYALSRAFHQGFKAFVEFDKEFVKLQQITGQSASSLQSLSQEITSLSKDLGISSSELTVVSTTLAQAGLSARDTERALRALALSALAPSFDSMNQTVEGSIALMKQFDIGAKDLEASLGSINAVSAKFAVEASDIIAAIQRTGGVFASASKGVSEGKQALNEFIAVFTSVRATTRESAETIASGLRTIFTRIQRGSTIEALKEFGVTLTDAEGKFVGAYKAIEALSKGLKSIDPRDLKFSQIIEELGGFRQIGKVIPLIQQFTTAQEALSVAQEGQGSLADDAATAQLSLANQMSKVREEFTAMVKEMGGTDTFKGMATGALALASALIKIADSMKSILPVLAIITAVRGASALRQYGTGFMGAIGGNRRGAAMGGIIQKYKKGGNVPVPVALMPGETVVYPDAVAKIGVGKLREMNHADKKMARGGIAKVPGSGRTDSFRTTLPSGSFVLRTDATSALGFNNIAHMAANGGRIGYKTGGHVQKIAKGINYAVSHLGDTRVQKQYFSTAKGNIVYGEALDNYTVALERGLNRDLRNTIGKNKKGKGISQENLLSHFERTPTETLFSTHLKGKNPGKLDKPGRGGYGFLSSGSLDDSRLVRDQFGQIAGDLKKDMVSAIKDRINNGQLKTPIFDSDLGFLKELFKDKVKIHSRQIKSPKLLEAFDRINEARINKKDPENMALGVKQIRSSRTTRVAHQLGSTIPNEQPKPKQLSQKPKNIRRVEERYYDNATENAIWPRHANGGIIQHFMAGSTKALKTKALKTLSSMGKSGLLEEAKKLGVEVPLESRSFLDPRSKGAEKARADLIQKLEDQRLIQKTNTAKTSQQAKRTRVAVIGSSGPSDIIGTSHEVTIPGVKNKAGRSRNLPATLEIGGYPEDSKPAKRIKAVIENAMARASLKVAKIAAKEAGIPIDQIDPKILKQLARGSMDPSAFGGIFGAGMGITANADRMTAGEHSTGMNAGSADIKKIPTRLAKSLKVTPEIPGDFTRGGKKLKAVAQSKASGVRKGSKKSPTSSQLGRALSDPEILANARTKVALGGFIQRLMGGDFVDPKAGWVRGISPEDLTKYNETSGKPPLTAAKLEQRDQGGDYIIQDFPKGLRPSRVPSPALMAAQQGQQKHEERIASIPLEKRRFPLRDTEHSGDRPFNKRRFFSGGQVQRLAIGGRASRSPGKLVPPQNVGPSPLPTAPSNKLGTGFYDLLDKSGLPKWQYPGIENFVKTNRLSRLETQQYIEKIKKEQSSKLGMRTNVSQLAASLQEPDFKPSSLKQRELGKRLAIGGEVQRQRLANAGPVVIKKSVIDLDALNSPSNAAVVRAEMDRLGISSIHDYKLHLDNHAASKQSSKPRSRFPRGKDSRTYMVHGVAGVGKSTMSGLGTGGTEGKLRQVKSYAALTTQDIDNADHVISATSDIGLKNRPMLEASNRLVNLSTRHEDSQAVAVQNREYRDKNKSSTLFEREPGSTKGANTDSGRGEAYAAAHKPLNEITTLKVGENFKKTRIGTPTVVSPDKMAVVTGNFGPTTPAHVEMAKIGAKKAGIKHENVVAMVANDVPIDPFNRDPEAERTAYLPQKSKTGPSRYGMAQAVFGAHGFSVDALPKGSSPNSMPNAFKTGRKDKKGEQIYLVPNDKTQKFEIGGNDKKETSRYPGYDPIRVSRTSGPTAGISATLARSAINSGNMSEIQKYLTPEGIKYIEPHLSLLRERPKLLDSILNRLQKNSALGKGTAGRYSAILEELKTLPARKTKTTPPEVLEQMEDGRKKRDRYKKKLGGLPSRMLRRLEARIPRASGGEIPIMAQAGEFVLNKHAAGQIGPHTLKKLNRGGKVATDALDSLPKYHTGGMVQNFAGGTPKPLAPVVKSKAPPRLFPKTVETIEKDLNAKIASIKDKTLQENLRLEIKSIFGGPQGAQETFKFFSTATESQVADSMARITAIMKKVKMTLAPSVVKTVSTQTPTKPANPASAQAPTKPVNPAPVAKTVSLTPPQVPTQTKLAAAAPKPPQTAPTNDPRIVANSFWDGATGQGRRSLLGVAPNADMPGIHRKSFDELSSAEQNAVISKVTGNPVQPQQGIVSTQKPIKLAAPPPQPPTPQQKAAARLNSLAVGPKPAPPPPPPGPVLPKSSNKTPISSNFLDRLTPEQRVHAEAELKAGRGYSIKTDHIGIQNKPSNLTGIDPKTGLPYGAKHKAAPPPPPTSQQKQEAYRKQLTARAIQSGVKIPALPPAPRKHAIGGEIPIMAKAGEFVINEHAAGQIGEHTLAKLNRGGRIATNTLDQLPKYHTGGSVQRLGTGGQPDTALAKEVSFRDNTFMDKAILSIEKLLMKVPLLGEAFGKAATVITGQASALKDSVKTARNHSDIGDSIVDPVLKKVRQSHKDMNRGPYASNLVETGVIGQTHIDQAAAAQNSASRPKKAAVGAYPPNDATKAALASHAATVGTLPGISPATADAMMTASLTQTPPSTSAPIGRRIASSSASPVSKSGPAAARILATKGNLIKTNTRSLWGGGSGGGSPPKRPTAGGGRSPQQPPTGGGTPGNNPPIWPSMSGGRPPTNPPGGGPPGGIGGATPPTAPNIAAIQQGAANTRPDRRAGAGFNAFGLSMAIPLVSEQFQTKHPESAAQAGKNAAIGTASGAAGAGIMLGSSGGSLGIVAGLTVAVAGAAKAIDDFHAAAKQFNIDDAKMKIEDSGEKLGKIFTDIGNKASVTPEQLAKLNAAIKVSTESALEAGNLSANAPDLSMTGVGATVLGGMIGPKTDGTGRGAQNYSNREMILQEKGMGAFLRSLSGADAELQELQSIAPKVAKRTASMFSDSASQIKSVFAKQLSSGTSIEDLMSGPEWDKQKEVLARSNAAIEQQLMMIQADTNLTAAQKDARKADTIALEADTQARKLSAQVKLDKDLKDLQKGLSQVSFSFNRMLNQMGSAVQSSVDSLNKLDGALSSATASAAGQAKVGPSQGVTDTLDVLKNTQAYGSDKQNAAFGRASQSFGSQSGNVEKVLKLNAGLEDTVSGTINKTVSESKPGDTNEAVGVKVQSALREKLKSLQFPPALGDKLSQQIGKKVAEMRTSGEDTVDFSKLVEDVPELAKSIDLLKNTSDQVTKSIEFQKTAFDRLAASTNEQIDLQVEANNRIRSAQSIMTKGSMELGKALGRTVSLSSKKAAIEAPIRAMTGGTTNAVEIGQNYSKLEGQRQQLESGRNQAAQSGDVGAVRDFDAKLKDASIGLRENVAALKTMADSTDLASASLEEIDRVQKKMQAGESGIEKLVTSTPKELANMNSAFARLQNNAQGISNTGTNADQRKQSLEVFNMIAPMLGSSAEEKGLKANVLQSMMGESGISMNPMMQQVLDTMRNPESNPELKAATDQYRMATETQAKANEQLAIINQNLSADIAAKTGNAVAEALKNNTVKFETQQLADILASRNTVPTDVPAATKARGGIIYKAVGGNIDRKVFQPKGTDTVPAMLTPGEFVVNRQSTKANLPLLHSINKGYSKGGKVTYLADGGYVGNFLSSEVGKGLGVSASTPPSMSNDLLPMINPSWITTRSNDKANAKLLFLPASYYPTWPSDGGPIPSLKQFLGDSNNKGPTVRTLMGGEGRSRTANRSYGQMLDFTDEADKEFESYVDYFKSIGLDDELSNKLNFSSGAVNKLGYGPLASFMNKRIGSSGQWLVPSMTSTPARVGAINANSMPLHIKYNTLLGLMTKDMPLFGRAQLNNMDTSVNIEEYSKLTDDGPKDPTQAYASAKYQLGLVEALEAAAPTLKTQLANYSTSMVADKDIPTNVSMPDLDTIGDLYSFGQNKISKMSTSKLLADKNMGLQLQTGGSPSSISLSSLSNNVLGPVKTGGLKIAGQTLGGTPIVGYGSSHTELGIPTDTKEGFLSPENIASMTQRIDGMMQDVDRARADLTHAAGDPKNFRSSSKSDQQSGNFNSVLDSVYNETFPGLFISVAKDKLNDEWKSLVSGDSLAIFKSTLRPGWEKLGGTAESISLNYAKYSKTPIYQVAGRNDSVNIGEGSTMGAINTKAFPWVGDSAVAQEIVNTYLAGQAIQAKNEYKSPFNVDAQPTTFPFDLDMFKGDLSPGLSTTEKLKSGFSYRKIKMPRLTKLNGYNQPKSTDPFQEGIILSSTTSLTDILNPFEDQAISTIAGGEGNTIWGATPDLIANDIKLAYSDYIAQQNQASSITGLRKATRVKGQLGAGADPKKDAGANFTGWIPAGTEAYAIEDDDFATPLSVAKSVENFKNKTVTSSGGQATMLPGGGISPIANKLKTTQELVNKIIAPSIGVLKAFGFGLYPVNSDAQVEPYGKALLGLQSSFGQSISRRGGNIDTRLIDVWGKIGAVGEATSLIGKGDLSTLNSKIGLGLASAGQAPQFQQIVDKVMSYAKFLSGQGSLMLGVGSEAKTTLEGGVDVSKKLPTENKTIGDIFKESQDAAIDKETGAIKSTKSVPPKTLKDLGKSVFNPYSQFNNGTSRASLIDFLMGELKNKVSQQFIDQVTVLKTYLAAQDTVISAGGDSPIAMPEYDAPNKILLQLTNGEFGQLPTAEKISEMRAFKIDQKIAAEKIASEGAAAPVAPTMKAKGGLIYASNGTYVDYRPKGTDTVPAMLTPGEFVVNRSSTQKHLPLLHAINSGGAQGLSHGGIANYLQSGGVILPQYHSNQNNPLVSPMNSSSGSGGGQITLDGASASRGIESALTVGTNALKAVLKNFVIAPDSINAINGFITGLQKVSEVLSKIDITPEVKFTGTVDVNVKGAEGLTGAMRDTVNQAISHAMKQLKKKNGTANIEIPEGPFN